MKFSVRSGPAGEVGVSEEDGGPASVRKLTLQLGELRRTERNNSISGGPGFVPLYVPVPTNRVDQRDSRIAVRSLDCAVMLPLTGMLS